MLNREPFRNSDAERRAFLEGVRNQARNMGAAVIDHILTEVETRGEIPREWKEEATKVATDGLCAALFVATAIYSKTPREAILELVKHAGVLVNAANGIEGKQ